MSISVPELKPRGRCFQGTDQRAPLIEGLIKAGEYSANQVAGRFFPTACVALEVTQRCNLDCTLCYLSDRAEMTHDVPMPLLLQRIGMIESHFGPRTNVQITGGDPTLRPIDDLVILCQEIRKRGMKSCLMTNGIKASREMLSRLAEAGLDDVAFHVDLTQERKGYLTEVSLNTLRDTYIERARGLGLRILFDTTVFDGNLSEVPALGRYFRSRAEDITLTSFQLQADTGRGVLRERDDVVSQQSVRRLLEKGFGAELGFDIASVGHSECNRYAAVLVAGEVAAPAFADAGLFKTLVAALEHHEDRIDGHLPLRVTLPKVLRRHPGLALKLGWMGLKTFWRLRRGLVATKGRAHRMSVLIHSFMDAEKLDSARCESCVFMVATGQGPLSMCVHNAQRDAHLFAPSQVTTPEGEKWWSAATGRMTDQPEMALPDAAPFKRLKGRQRAEAASARKGVKAQ